jgi:hypothetical protein
MILETGYFATFELIGKNCKGVTLIQSGGQPVYGKTQRALNDEINWFIGLLKHGGHREMSNLKKFKVIEL